MGLPEFFVWIHLLEPTTKIRMNEVQKRIIPKTTHYLDVQRLEEEEAFCQPGEGDIISCLSGLQPEWHTSRFVDMVD